jgi:signal transduction histidine kinase
MGLRLVRSLVDQLKGRLTVEGSPRTVVTVTLPEEGD